MKTILFSVLGGTLVSANAILPRQVAYSPLNPTQVAAAPAPSITGPPVTAVSNSVNYNAASASSIGAQAAVATGIIPGSRKEKRNFPTCWTFGPWTFGNCYTTTSTSSAPLPTVVPTVVPTVTGALTCATTPYTPYYPAVTVGTATQYRTTGTTYAPGACPTTPEAGTYCGFINPEDACAPQPDGYGPVPTPDTPAAFLAYAPFAQSATSAITPPGYSLNFTNLQAEVSASSYLALMTLQTYSPAQCAAYCDCTSTCSAFNLVIERDPNLAPAANCTNPPSMTSYKCLLFAGPISAADATNNGQYRSAFQIVVAGSNGYNKLPAAPGLPPVPVYNPPTYCPGGAISAPGKSMGGSFFPGPFDPRVCATYAQTQTAKNKASCSWGHQYQACNYFNAFAVQQNGSYAGFQCNLFTAQPGWGDGPSTGSYTGCQSGNTPYNVAWSWSYQLPIFSQNNGWGW